jgi:polysaccharide pyruvyl transferase WcaK-like protein
VGFVVEPVAPARAVLAGLPDPFPPGQLVVGLNASGLLARGGYTGRNMFGLRENYNQLVARLIERLVERHHALVLLVPHTFGPPGSEADAPVCRQLYEEFACRFPGRVGWLAAEHAHDEIRHVIGRCDFFVGSRMHACIAALSQGVPTVAIAYSDKFRQALAPLDDGVTILDARSLGLGDILEGVAKALAERSHARGILDSRLPASRREVLDLFAPVAPFVAPPRR